MKLSIAMATYNGAQYIEEQFKSFSAQTLLPDELVVCDDCSTDSTLDIIEALARGAAFKVRVHRNEKRLGYARNFEKALSLCENDLIFLSDQDDVWFPEKLKLVRDAFVSHPEIEVVINDAEVADAQLHPSGATMLSNMRRAGLNDRLFITGCCTTITRKWRDFILPLPSDDVAHDLWINIASFYTDKRLVLERPLQYYRRHQSTATDWTVSSAKPPSLLKVIMDHLFADSSSGWTRTRILAQSVRDRLADKSPPHMQPSDVERSLRRIESEIRLLDGRLMAVSKSRILRAPLIISLLTSGSYGAAKGWKSALRDFLAPRTQAAEEPPPSFTLR
ncbi:glycosyltransferase family 2 protein [Methylocystis echinoides]|uniref:glycosyltransferase family 2 protein n=1 Tax=Methylocystis echinoides TaxID=29468 RepID=UPI0034452643